MSERERTLEIAGFEPQRLLGSGGFANVWLCHQAAPERNVAIKVLHARLSDETVQSNFVTEANLLAVLSSHPAIVTIHETGIAADGHPFFVMEYCSQPNLDERSRARPFSVPEMIQTMIRLSGAVATAHLSGIIHRDIKPANVLTTDYGWPALADFGIAQLTQDQTESGSAVSVPWAAPEVLLGGAIDERSDVYGLGATAWTLLTGYSPFDGSGVGEPGGSLHELIKRVLEEPVQATERPDVPPALERLLAVSLAKHPSDRQQTVSEFARSLQRIEQDLHLPITHFDTPASVSAEGFSGESAELDAAEHTRVTGSHTVDESTRVSTRTAGAEETVVAERTELAEQAEFVDRTELVERTELDDSSVVGVDEETRLNPRLGQHIDDHSAEKPSADNHSHNTVAVQPAQLKQPTNPVTVVTHSSTRIGYDPSVQGVRETQYGVRESTSQPPVRRDPLPQKSATPTPTPETDPKRTPLPLRNKVLMLAGGTGIVMVGLIVLVGALLKAGVN